MVGPWWFVEKEARVRQLDRELEDLISRVHDQMSQWKKLEADIEEAKLRVEEAKDVGWREDSSETEEIRKRIDHLETLERRWTTLDAKINSEVDHRASIKKQRADIIIEYNTRVQTVTDPAILNGLPREIPASGFRGAEFRTPDGRLQDG